MASHPPSPQDPPPRPLNLEVLIFFAKLIINIMKPYIFSHCPNIMQFFEL